MLFPRMLLEIRVYDFARPCLFMVYFLVEFMEEA